jgi:cation:H+ antiporter
MMIASIVLYIFILNGFMRLWQGLIFIIFLILYVFLSLYFSKKDYGITDDAKLQIQKSLPFTLLIIFLASIGLLFFSKYTAIGLVLVSILTTYTFLSLFILKSNYDPLTGKKGQVHYSLPVTFLVICLSATCLAISSYLLVDNAAIIAKKIGISERVISISVIAFGTSVPELATSMIAAFKKEMDISIGNIIGSNIFNILGVLGIASLITPIPISDMIIKVDMLWMLGISFLLLLFILPLKGGRLTRIKGITLFVIYCVYIYLLFIKLS